MFKVCDEIASKILMQFYKKICTSWKIIVKNFRIQKCNIEEFSSVSKISASHNRKKVTRGKVLDSSTDSFHFKSKKSKNDKKCFVKTLSLN